VTFPLWNPLPTGVVLSELVGACLLLLPTSPGVRAVVVSVQFPTEGGYPVSFAWVDALDARGVLTLPDGDAHDRPEQRRDPDPPLGEQALREPSGLVHVALGQLDHRASAVLAANWRLRLDKCRHSLNTSC